MKAGEIIGSFVESIIKIVVAIVIVMYVYKWATAAYDFGYRIFTEEPMSVGEGRIISVEITEDATAKSIGQMLEDRGLIRDKNVFFLQELRYIIQTLRCHLPLHCSHGCSAGILRLAISPLTIRFHSSALVDIDSQEIQRFRDQFQVFRIP